MLEGELVELIIFAGHSGLKMVFIYLLISSQICFLLPLPGLPYFPYDWPGTVAYETEADELSSLRKDSWEKMPPAKRGWNYKKFDEGSLGWPDKNAFRDGFSTLNDELPLKNFDGMNYFTIYCPNMIKIIEEMYFGSLYISPASLYCSLAMQTNQTHLPDILPYALLRVNVEVLGKGSPDDQAVLYSVDSHNLDYYTSILNAGHDGNLELDVFPSKKNV